MRRALPFLLALGGCAVTRGVAPLEQGQHAVTASLGGPVFSNLGTPLPMPISALGYAHGLRDDLTVYGALYPSGLALFGVPGFDLGAAYEALPPSAGRPRVMVTGTAYAFYGSRKVAGGPDGGLRIWPGAAVVASWDLGARAHHLYVGWDSFFGIGPTRFHYFGSPMTGAEWRVSDRVGLQLEGKWVAPYEDVKPNFVEWAAPARHGAISIQLGAVFTFGGAP